MSQSRGFSLVEAVIALAVFSFVAVAGVYAMRLGVDGGDAIEETNAYVSRIEALRSMVRRDLWQITERTARDQFGALNEFPFYGGAGHPQAAFNAEEDLLFSFVRRGWINPDARLPRSDLQYVQYIFRDGALLRRVRPFVDAARDQPTAERVLVDGLEAATPEFLRGEAAGRLDWTPDWPAGSSASLPRAVALTLSDRRNGGVRHLFWVGDISE
ncbi:MAG: type II secretion system minor pseudopilin GspJ [Pseudomonadota bacterium]